MGKHFNALFLTIYFSLPITVFSQITFQYQGRPISEGARITALGSAGAGDASDANSIYWNPAALSFIQQSTVMFTSNRGLEGRSLENTLSVPPLSLGHNQVIALGISGSLYGRKWTVGTFSFLGADVGYSIKVDPALSVGVVTNFHIASNPSRFVFVSSSSIGAFYEPNDGISYGIVFNGFGTGANYYTDYIYTAAGIESKINEQQLQRTIRIGLNFRYPSVYRPPYLAILLESEKSIGISGQIFRGGIEVLPIQSIALRFGLIARPSIILGTFGAGVNIAAIQIDYAISPTTAADSFQQISISYAFNR